MLGNDETSAASRHQVTRGRIVALAWAQARTRGLAAMSMRELGAAAGMRAPSLYTYFASKTEIYDEMFAQGWAACVVEVGPAMRVGDRRTALREMAAAYAAFCLRDTVRYQLMCQRVIPRYVPSPRAYEVSQRAMASVVDFFGSLGITRPSDVDLWTALVTGILDQQIANDPDGDRWTTLIDRAVDMYVAHLEGDNDG